MDNKLTILGSGTVLSSYYHPFDYRHPAAHLLQYGGKNILLDCGEGVRGRLHSIKFDYYDLDAIFITHFHPDHFSIETMIPSYIERAKKEKKKKRLQIFGPKNIREILAENLDRKHFPNFFATIVMNTLDLEFVEYENEKEIVFSKNIKLTPYKVFHGIMDAYALRLQLDTTILTYSGDSSECPGLVSAAKDADIFMCEAAIDIDDPLAFTQAHVSSYQAGKMAKEANAKRLILVHYNGKDTPEKMLEEIQRAGFTGKITVASDFQNFSL